MPDVRLKTEFYFKDIVALGTEISSLSATKRTGSISIHLYVGDALATVLTMNATDLYIVALKGADRVHSAGDFGGENYNQLGMPTTLTLGGIRELTKLGQHSSGMKFDTTLLTRAAVVVAEATRFQAVQMHIQGLLSGAFSSVPLAELDKQCFKNWSKTSNYIRSGAWTPGPQIVVDVLCAPAAKIR